MDKMKLAHDAALAMINSGYSLHTAIADAWAYADAMQAEADNSEKEEAAQKRKEIRDMLTHPNTFVEREGQHFDDVEEWQPDWSQAPEWAKWWAMDGFSNEANWYYSTPYLDEDSDGEYEWNIELRSNGETYSKAPSFNYHGNWKDSLRERPHGF